MLRDFSTFSRTCIFFLLTLSLLWSSLFFSSLLWLFPPLLFHLSILSEVWLLNFPSIIDDDWLWLWYFKLRSGSATNLSEWVYCDSILYYVLFPAIHTQFCWQKYPIIWRRSFPSSNRWGLLLTWIQNLSQPLLSRGWYPLYPLQRNHAIGAKCSSGDSTQLWVWKKVEKKIWFDLGMVDVCTSNLAAIWKSSNLILAWRILKPWFLSKGLSATWGSSPRTMQHVWCGA